MSSQVKRVNRCSKCGEQGHNRASCKKVIQTTQLIETAPFVPEVVLPVKNDKLDELETMLEKVKALKDLVDKQQEQIVGYSRLVRAEEEDKRRMKQQMEEEIRKREEEEKKRLEELMEEEKKRLEQQKYFNTRGNPIRFLFGGRFNPACASAEWRLLKLAYETGTAEFVYFGNSHASRGETEPHDTINVRYVDDTSYSYELVYHIYFKTSPDGKKLYTHITNLDGDRNPKIVARWKVE